MKTQGTATITEEVVAPTGTFADSLTISGVPVSTGTITGDFVSTSGDTMTGTLAVPIIEMRYTSSPALPRILMYDSDNELAWQILHNEASGALSIWNVQASGTPPNPGGPNAITINRGAFDLRKKVSAQFVISADSKFWFNPPANENHNPQPPTDFMVTGSGYFTEDLDVDEELRAGSATIAGTTTTESALVSNSMIVANTIVAGNIAAPSGIFTQSLTNQGHSVLPIPYYRLTYFEADNQTVGNTWTNMPAAESFWLGSSISVRYFDTRPFTEVRLSCLRAGNVAPIGSAIQLKFATAYSTNGSDYNGMTTAGSPLLLISGTQTHSVSDWQTLLPEARIENCYLAVLGSGGDGAMDPVFGNIEIDFR